MGGDHRSKLTAEASWIAERLAAEPELTLTEVRGDLAGRGTEVSYTSVWRTVKKLGLRLKKNNLRQRARPARRRDSTGDRSEEHTSELQSLMRISYAVFCLKKKKKKKYTHV